MTATVDGADVGTGRADSAGAHAAAARAVRAARRRPVRRRRLVVVGLGLALLGAVLTRTLLGDFTITIADAVRIVGGAQLAPAGYLLMETKLPRAVLGVLVGGAFGLGGAIFQSTLRNPLASPDIVGVSAGASAGAVAAIVGLGLTGPPVTAAAVVGAVAAALLIRAVGGTAGGQRLVVVGIVAAAGLTSVVQYFMTRADVYDAQFALGWLTGSLNRAQWPAISALALALAALVPFTAWQARTLGVSELGPDVAVVLGESRARIDRLLLAGVLLTAVGVAAAGPVACVAFLSGPVARALNGGRTTLLGAALTGALIVVAADHVAAYALGSANLPVGVVTGAVGAPVLLWLIARGRTGRNLP